MATTATIIPTLSPTAVWVVGLKPNDIVLQQFAAWNDQSETPVTEGEVTEATLHCPNLPDLGNQEAATLQLRALQDGVTSCY